MKTFEVTLWASMPASAKMKVEAESEEAAKQYAYENIDEADWDGSDCSRPDGSMIDRADVKEVA